MKAQNRKLLEKVQKDRLEKSLLDDPDGKTFKEAMEATEKLNEIDKLEFQHLDNLEKLKSEKELQKEKLESELRALKAKYEQELYLQSNKHKDDLELQTNKHKDDLELQKEKFIAEAKENQERQNKEFKRNVILSSLTAIAAPLIVLGTKFILGRSNTKLIGQIEQYETPVTTPGKAHHKNLIENFKL